MGPGLVDDRYYTSSATGTVDSITILTTYKVEFRMGLSSPSPRYGMLIRVLSGIFSLVLLMIIVFKSVATPVNSGRSKRI